MSSVTLYDIPGRDNRGGWSLNPWKSKVGFYPELHCTHSKKTARLALNFKGIEYDTEWLEYPNIAPVLKAKYVTPGVSVSRFPRFSVDVQWLAQRHSAE
jgi:hypothetical protein